MSVQQYVDQFHTLAGKTVGEKLKNLNDLILHLKSRCSKPDIEKFIVGVKPENNFEKLLKGRLIDSLKSKDLIDVLKCDDRLFIKQVLGCDWFFEGSSTDFPTCEFFVTDVFPDTSFIVRNDIIHLLSLHLKDESVAEQFFIAIRNEYGIKQARPLLCVCSAHFIQSVLDADDDRLQFSEREVATLVKKYPQLIKENIQKKCLASHWSNILKLMLDVDLKIFMSLFEEFENICPKLGRRSTKKIIRCNPDAIIKSATKYIKVMEPRFLHKYLNDKDFKQLYIALFPKSFDVGDFFNDHGDFYEVVEVVDPKKRLEMLLSCFEQVYGKKLLEQIDLVREKLLLLLPPDQREMCAQKKIDKCLSKDEDETHWICFLTTKKSVPMLKKLLVEAKDLDSRCELISCLIRTCKVNEDLETLASVCKYVVSRYRNDNIRLRGNILRELDSEFDLLKLDDRHWSCILEFIKVLFLNEEYRQVWVVVDILVKSIHYKLNNHMVIDEQIDQVICIKADECYYSDTWIIFRDEPKYQQIVFKAFGERIPLVKKVKVPLTKVAISLLKSVCEWNKKEKILQLSLSEFPWAVESLRKIVDSNLDGDKETVLELLKYDLETKQLVSPDHIFKEEIKKDVQYFMKMDTENFIKNAQEEMQYLLDRRIKKYRHVFRTWNLQSFMQIRDVVIEICSKIVESEQETQRRENAIFVLSFLLEDESFSNVVKPFYPETEKIDLEDEKTIKMLPLTKTSAMSLKNVNPWHNLSSLVQFCKGDYLKYVLGSLISVSYNTVQKKVIPFLDELTNSPVSVKKHAVRLSFNIVSKPKRLPLLNNLWCADSNPAMREIFFTLVTRAFVAEPTADMFKLLKYCLLCIRVDDKNLFEKLSDDKDITDDYKAEFLELCWDKSHDLLQQGAKTKSVISALLSRFTYVVELLPSSFCDRVIKQYLCEGSLYMDACINFAVSYILTCCTDTDITERFDLISNLFKVLVALSVAGRRHVVLFITCLCRDVLFSKRQLIPKVLEKVQSIWPSLLSPVHTFETFLLLKFTSLYFSCSPEFNLVSFGKISSEYITSVLEEYGPEAITLVSRTFNAFVNDIEIFCRKDFEKQETRVKVITGLFTDPVPKHAYIMAAHLIPDEFSELKEVKDMYLTIIETVFKVEDKSVCLLINSLPVFQNNLQCLDN